MSHLIQWSIDRSRAMIGMGRHESGSERQARLEAGAYYGVTGNRDPSKSRATGLLTPPAADPMGAAAKRLLGR